MQFLALKLPSHLHAVYGEWSRFTESETLMVPAHFHDVTHDKMKSNLIINIAGLH